jgi:Tol biopolymer transport system component
MHIAPDDERYFERDPDGKWRVHQFSGTPSKPIPNLTAADFVISWTADSKAVYVEVTTGSGDSIHIDRVDVATGTRTLWREDAGPKGMHESWMPMITPDGKARVYTYGHGVSSLWIADGLR